MFFQDIFFPASCLICGKLGSFLCLRCQKRLKTFKKYICFYCKKPSLFGFTHPLCKRKTGVDGCVFIYHYNNELKKIIKKIKYRLVREGLKELLQISSKQTFDKLNVIIKLYKGIFLVPVPLYKKRFLKRGFNQAEEISFYLQKYFNIPVKHCLIRKRNTKSQARIKSLKKRFLNLKGAFSIKRKLDVKNKTIILVDDIVTSGSTIREATGVLKRNGALKVFVFALAKG